MIRYAILILAASFIAVRLVQRSRAGSRARPRSLPALRLARLPLGLSLVGDVLGDTGMIAEREMRERFRGRIFRLGTLVILVAVVLGIVIPTLRHPGRPLERIGIVDALPAAERADLSAAATTARADVRLVSERSLGAADADLRSGRIAVAVVDGRRVVTEGAVGPTDGSATAQLARTLSSRLGVDEAVAAAGLSPAQLARLRQAAPLPLVSLTHGRSRAARTTSLIGLPLLFFLFLTYNSWILFGVMEEKSSRVVEVLLASIRPLQLLTGKVLGIGLVALTQAALIVAATLVTAKAVGSSVSAGATPLFLGATFAWLLLGYAFYCWVYAAAGSMAERRDQVQSLLLPLNLPLVLGYIVSVSAQGSGSAGTLVKVLAYLPPTAPFAMPALVGLGAATWWQFAASAALSVVSTVAVARLAAGIYRRSILRTGGRVPLRDALRPAA